MHQMVSFEISFICWRSCSFFNAECNGSVLWKPGWWWRLLRNSCRQARTGPVKPMLSEIPCHLSHYYDPLRGFCTCPKSHHNYVPIHHSSFQCPHHSDCSNPSRSREHCALGGRSTPPTNFHWEFLEPVVFRLWEYNHFLIFFIHRGWPRARQLGRRMSTPLRNRSDVPKYPSR